MILLALLLSTATAPPPPSVLAPYIKEGRFDPGDFGWMRGRFADATPLAKAEWSKVNTWLTACTKAGGEALKRDLQAAGIADPKVNPQPYKDEYCGAVMTPTLADEELKSFAVFQAALAETQPVVVAVIWTTQLAEQHARARENTLRAKLLARPIGEQILRQAMDIGEKEGPALSSLARKIAQSLIWSAVRSRDQANTTWLKSVVTNEGWPTIGKVGERAADAAWLLVQHADEDPIFQLRVLRLMEPLLASGEVSKGNYAYLYDRVMLKIAGKQRYATQMMCRDGSMEPQPIEDASKVDRLRREAGLEPLAEYRKNFTAKC
jgi:hypothetical protein